MYFLIETDDEVAGLDIVAALSGAGIKHSLLSKTKIRPTLPAPDKGNSTPEKSTTPEGDTAVSLRPPPASEANR